MISPARAVRKRSPSAPAKVRSAAALMGPYSSSSVCQVGSSSSRPIGPGGQTAYALRLLTKA
jgi:hypothetical protein